MSNSGLVQASQTILGGPSNIRVRINSRSDLRSTVARFYVADGAIVPEALGVNPSRTIGALASLIAAR